MGSITLRNAVRRILEEDDLKKVAMVIADELDDVNNKTPGIEAARAIAALNEEDEDTIPTFVAEAKKAIKEGKYKVGDIVLEKYGVRWRLVDISGEDYTIMTECAFTYAPFDRPDKKHPWGSNDWGESQIRKELNGIWLPQMMGAETKLVKAKYAAGVKLFLLSEEEAGFKQTENTFDYFRPREGEDEEDLNKRRQLKDYEGDKCLWWLRSPYPGHANSVRRVGSDGSLSRYDARDGYGAVAACVI
jgi:hypothetical protein